MQHFNTTYQMSKLVKDVGLELKVYNILSFWIYEELVRPARKVSCIFPSFRATFGVGCSHTHLIRLYIYSPGFVSSTLYCFSFDHIVFYITLYLHYFLCYIYFKICNKHLENWDRVHMDYLSLICFFRGFIWFYVFVFIYVHCYRTQFPYYVIFVLIDSNTTDFIPEHPCLLQFLVGSVLFNL